MKFKEIADKGKAQISKTIAEAKASSKGLATPQTNQHIKEINEYLNRKLAGLEMRKETKEIKEAKAYLKLLLKAEQENFVRAYH